MTRSRKRITVEVLVDAGLEDAWNAFVEPEAVMEWNFATSEWHCPRAVNELRVGGTFDYRMEAVDGSAGFDFGGRYTDVRPKEGFRYTMGDGREVSTHFEPSGAGTRVRTIFEAEDGYTPERQQAGWQAILDNYKRYVEGDSPR